MQVTYRTKSISMLAFIASTLLLDYPVTTASFHLVYVDTIVKGRRRHHVCVTRDLRYYFAVNLLKL